MKRVLVIIALLGASVACGSSGHPNGTTASVRACRSELVQELLRDYGSDHKPTEPPSCVGLDRTTLNKVAGQAAGIVIKKELGNE